MEFSGRQIAVVYYSARELAV